MLVTFEEAMDILEEGLNEAVADYEAFCEEDSVILEDAGKPSLSDRMKSTGKAIAGSKIIKWIVKIFTVIADQFEKLAFNFRKWIAKNGKSKVQITEDVQVLKASLKKDNKIIKIINKIVAGRYEDLDDAIDYLAGVSLKPDYTIKKGTIVDYAKVAENLLDYTTELRRIKAVHEKLETAKKLEDADINKLKDVVNKLIKVLNAYKRDIEQLKLLLNGAKYTETDEDAENKIKEIKAKNSQAKKDMANNFDDIDEEIAKKIANKYQKMDDKLGAEAEKYAAKVKKEKAAKAAKAVKNESIDYDELSHTMNLLEEASALLQQVKPEVTADEYDSEASGGEGEISDKEIMEILDGDKEAYEILTDDDGSAITESIMVEL